MSERSYNVIQYSFFVNGDQYVLRADTGAELLAAVNSINENADEFLKSVNALKQVNVASGVFTGGGKASGGATASSDERKSDTPPPSSNSSVPNCGCGIPMKDLAHKNFKNRFYASDDCKNKGKSKECWAKK